MHGSTYAMCHRLYRPGYSMPELSTPPRRASTCRVTSSSRAGSNGESFRRTRTPPAVSNCFSPISALASVSGRKPGGADNKSDRRLPGGRYQDLRARARNRLRGGATSLRSGSRAWEEPSSIRDSIPIVPGRALRATDPGDLVMIENWCRCAALAGALTTMFAPVTTTKLRVVMQAAPTVGGVGAIQWVVPSIPG
jgi:hypothetical protein